MWSYNGINVILVNEDYYTTIYWYVYLYSIYIEYDGYTYSLDLVKSWKYWVCKDFGGKMVDARVNYQQRFERGYNISIVYLADIIQFNFTHLLFYFLWFELMILF